MSPQHIASAVEAELSSADIYTMLSEFSVERGQTANGDARLVATLFCDAYRSAEKMQ